MCTLQIATLRLYVCAAFILLRKSKHFLLHILVLHLFTLNAHLLLEPLMALLALCCCLGFGSCYLLL